MKKAKHRLLPSVIIGMFLAVLNAKAAIFTNLYTFKGIDGANSFSHLVLSGNTLFGTTSSGGSGGGNSGYGTIFKINTDSSGFTNLYSFTNGTDGANPMAGLVLSSNTLYGTASTGGGNNGTGFGTVFKINTDSTGFATLYNFTNINMNDGNFPLADLLLSGNVLYGTTSGGGLGVGNVFRINTDGTCFTNIYSFDDSGDDGANPMGNLILSGNTLYGTTSSGGGEFGSIFKVNTDGTGFMVLHDFTDTQIGPNDGGSPQAGMVLVGNTLYGTAEIGGKKGYGVIFTVNIDNNYYTNLYSFTNGTDGAFPIGGLILCGGNLFGTTSGGQGSAGYGTIFKVNTDGKDFTNLHNFTDLNGMVIQGPDEGVGPVLKIQTNSDGALPESTLTLFENTLYGTTVYGGAAGKGTTFALSLGSIPLKMQASASNVVLAWGNPAFSLQAAPTATGIYTNVSSAASPYTNNITGSQMFFRLQSD